MDFENPGRRICLDDLEGAPMATMAPVSDVASHHLKNAMTSTCVALQFARSRSQAMSCWGALRSLLEAKFGSEEDR